MLTEPNMVEPNTYYMTPSHIVAKVLRVKDDKSQVYVDIAGYVQWIDMEDFCRRFNYIQVPPMN